MRYLRAEEILAIHDETIEKEGGLLGIRDFGLLCSVAEKPRLSLMGQEIYPDVFLKAASLLEGLATYHVFADGNKRSAFMSCATFLGLNGFDLIIAWEDAFSFLLQVAQKQHELREVADWLKKHSK